MPSVMRDSVTKVATTANEINIFRVENLNQDCSGEVTAIEYCYLYDLPGGVGEIVFRWTVLILEDTGAGNFRITNSYTVESRPNSSSSVHCSAGDKSGRINCCDSEQINGFIFSVNFVYGVIGPSQGNTYGASLLGVHDTALPQYQVNTIIVLRSAGQTLSVGSTLPSGSIERKGVRMLWFVIGKLNVRITNIP